MKELKRLEQAIKAAKLPPTQSGYVKDVIAWLTDWVEDKPGGPSTQDDSGDHPPPPPPRH